MDKISWGHNGEFDHDGRSDREKALALVPRYVVGINRDGTPYRDRAFYGSNEVMEAIRNAARGTPAFLSQKQKQHWALPNAGEVVARDMYTRPKSK